MVVYREEAPPAANPGVAAAVSVERISTTNQEYCDARLRACGLNVSHNQMSQGTFSAEIARISISPDLEFSLSSYATAITSQGTAPDSKYALCLPVSNPDGVYFNSRSMGESEIGVLRPNQEFHLYRTPHFRSLVVYPDAALIERHCEAMFGRSPAKMVGGGQGLSSTDGAVAACARHFAQLCDESIIDQQPLNDLVARCGPERVVAELVDDILGVVCPPTPVRGWSARQRVLNRAWEIVEDDNASVVTVANLCMRMGVPIRTLDDAFRECLGITPKRFILGVRLNKVRRRLSRPDDETTVTSVATAFSFFHFGHFASQYRELFGETPSYTLARARGEQGARFRPALSARAIAREARDPRYDFCR